MKIKDLWKSQEDLEEELEHQDLIRRHEEERNNVLDLVMDKIVEDYILSEDLSKEEKDMYASMFDLWEPNVRYEKGNKVLYRDGNIYEVVQPHESMAQYDIRELPALYKLFHQRETSDGIEVISPWTQPYGSEDPYLLGDVVSHEGKIWKSVFDGANVWEPGVFGWVEREG